MEKVNVRSEEITKNLLFEIREGRYASSKKLPPEIVVAKEMGVSRTLIRDCFATLEREGFISRKHGVGTIINPHIVHAQTRMDLEKEFLEMVTEAGFQADMKVLYYGEKSADDQIADRLAIKPGEIVLESRRLVTANSRPAIFCYDYIAISSLTQNEFDLKLLEKPVFCFIDQYCSESVYMDLTEVSAVLPDKYLSEILEISIQTPLLYMDEVGYTFLGKPLLYSKEYYVNDILHHKVMRKKI